MEISFSALNTEQIGFVSEQVERLLSEQGVQVKDPDTCAFFVKRGAKQSGERIYISKEMLEGALKSVPQQFTLHARNPEKTVTIGLGNPPAINTCSGMSFYQDADGFRRRATVEDQIKMLKLSHSSKVISFSNAGILYPGINPDDAKFVQMINALTYSDKPFFSQGADQHFGEAAIAMSRMVTGYQDKCVCMSVVNSLSPLAWDKKMLGMIYTFAKENQPINISSSSMVGATSPVFLAGTLITSVAESLFGIVYSQLVSPGTPVVFGCFPGVMDMLSAQMSYGSPEFSILCAAASQMASHYKLPFRGGGAMTDAKATNMQCGIESALQMMVALNSNVHYMHQSIGTLDSILACSAEKFVMDEEIVTRVQRMKRGIGEFPDDLMDVIEEGRESGSFLGLLDTALNFKDQIYFPTFSDRSNYEAWTSKGKSNELKASDIVGMRLSEYVEPDIGVSLKKELRDYATKQGADISSILS